MLSFVDKFKFIRLKWLSEHFNGKIVEFRNDGQDLSSQNMKCVVYTIYIHQNAVNFCHFLVKSSVQNLFIAVFVLLSCFCYVRALGIVRYEKGHRQKPLLFVFLALVK